MGLSKRLGRSWDFSVPWELRPRKYVKTEESSFSKMDRPTLFLPALILVALAASAAAASEVGSQCKEGSDCGAKQRCGKTVSRCKNKKIGNQR